MITDWVYAYPGTLEALIAHEYAPEYIWEMSTDMALACAAKPLLSEEEKAVLRASMQAMYTPATITYVAAHVLHEQLRRRDEALERPGTTWPPLR